MLQRFAEVGLLLPLLAACAGNGEGLDANGRPISGLRTGPIAWLAEADYIDDGSLEPRRKQWAGLIEANWKFLPGQNLKLTAEEFDPDTDVREDQQVRYSLVWEYVPIQFAQLRAGVRYYDGIPQNDRQNRQQFFLQLNGYF